jgi:transcriptional regulator with GAF, ATPase, and Fis domain
VLSTTREVSTRVQAQQLLEQRVEERTRELSTLLEISRNVASIIDLKPLLGLILDQLKTGVDYSGAAINTLEEEDFVIVDYRGFRPREQMLGRRLSLKPTHLIKAMILRREPVIIDMEVCDDGVGFDPTRAFPGHLGLRSMQERIRNLSGTFQIESVPGQGTCIRVCILVM